MAAEINKAVVPEDYARLIYSQTDREKLSMTNTSIINTIKTHDLTSTSSNESDRIDVSNLPTYDIVGEIECIYAKGTLTSITPLPGRNYKITSRFKIDPEVLSKYRLIRLIVQPNFYFFISSNILNLSYTVSLSINDLVYTYTPSIIIASNYGPQKTIDYTNQFAFIFDTKTKEFVRDTKSTTLWSSIYTPISINAEEES